MIRITDIKTQNIVKSVHIEAGWDPVDWRGETRWLQSIADEHGYPHAIVAFVDLLAPDLRARLDALACHPNLRGVRMRFFDPEQLADGATSTSSLMSEPKWREGFALLRDYDLGFDLQAPAGLMADAADLAAALPDIQLILTHAGLPLDRSDGGMEEWRQGMRLLAGRENVAVKISGFPMTDWHWTIDSLRPLVLETIDLFGRPAVWSAATFRWTSCSATSTSCSTRTATSPPIFQRVRSRISFTIPRRRCTACDTNSDRTKDAMNPARSLPISQQPQQLQQHDDARRILAGCSFTLTQWSNRPVV